MGNITEYNTVISTCIFVVQLCTHEAMPETLPEKERQMTATGNFWLFHTAMYKFLYAKDVIFYEPLTYVISI